MQIQIKKPFLERAISPLAFQQNEYVDLPEKLAQKLIKQGKAINVKQIQTPLIETR